MVRVLRVVAALVLLTGCTAGSADGPQFTKFHLDVEALREGEVRTDMDLTYDFADVPSHGIFLSLITEREIEGDEDRMRHTPVIRTGAASADGSADMTREAFRQGVNVRIGDPDRTVTGEHDYHVNYSMDGLVDSGTGPGGADEIYWNIIGSNFQEPINDIKIRLAGPGEILTAECWAGKPKSTDPCMETRTDSTGVTFSHDRLDPGEGITVGIAFAPGSFAPQQPQYLSAIKPEPIPWATIALGLLAATSFAILSYGAVRWWFRDEMYLDLPPGLTPPSGGQGRVGRASIFRPKPAVAFTPPEGVTPAQAAALFRRKFGSKAISATIVDLAVRGYLTIATLDKGIEVAKVHSPTRGSGTDYERAVLRALFSKQSVVHLGGRKSDVPMKLSRTASVLAEELLDRGWINRGKGRARKVLRWVAIIGFTPLLIIVGGMVTDHFWEGVAAFAGPLGFFGGIFIGLGKARQRSASGYAKYVQTLAFKKYLHQAEARQLQFEADEDTFSRYLPYAIALGEVEKWFAAFEESAGSNAAATPWLNGGGVNLLASAAAQTQLLGGLGAVGSGGSAGAYGVGSFSAGGGYVGGGLGGGGGGRW